MRRETASIYKAASRGKGETPISLIRARYSGYTVALEGRLVCAFNRAILLHKLIYSSMGRIFAYTICKQIYVEMLA